MDRVIWWKRVQQLLTELLGVMVVMVTFNLATLGNRNGVEKRGAAIISPFCLHAFGPRPQNRTRLPPPFSPPPPFLVLRSFPQRLSVRPFVTLLRRDRRGVHFATDKLSLGWKFARLAFRKDQE